MSTLPNEILINILTHLSQRYVVTICSTVCKKWNLVIFQSTFYSTIHIYSKKQLIKVIQLAKERKLIINDDKHIGYYVKHLIIHYYYTPEIDIITELLVFPNLQSIDGLHFRYSSAHIYNKSVYLQLNHSTDFSYWYYNEQWITKFNEIKNNLKSLKIYVTKELFEFIPQQQQQSTEIIHMKTIGIYTEANLNYNNSIRMLILPKASLMNLTKLKIDFFRLKNFSVEDKYIINEQTFENIHHSCPLLESLSITDFFMIVSDTYHHHHHHNTIIPAYRLMNIDFVGANINHPLCFQYLAVKYPHLKSLYLHLWSERQSNIEKTPIRQAIFNMILQFPLLKKLSYISKADFILDSGDMTERTREIWPHSQFIAWLYKHPNQFKYLEYPFDFIINISREMDETDTNKNITPLQQQLNFLNHLTSLSLRIDNAVHLALNYLLQNKNTITASTTLENLIIERNKTDHNKYIYIYDWLDIFPNLATLKLGKIEKIIDSEDGVDDDNNDINNNNEDGNDNIYIRYSVKLHQVIKHRKQQQQQQQQHQQQHDIIKKENKIIFYKLKNLEICNGKICFKNGIDELLKKCQQLKNLKLKENVLICPIYSISNIHFDLSHLHLESLSIDEVRFSPNIDHQNFNHINQLIIHETSPYCKRIIAKTKYRTSNQNNTLFLKCKYIDKLL